MIVTRIDSLSHLAAQSTRVAQLQAALLAADNAGDIAVDEKYDGYSDLALCVRDLSLYTPDGRDQLSHELSFELARGTKLLVVGDSGCGKSSMLRCFAGLWRKGSGSVKTMQASECTFEKKIISTKR